MSLHSISTSCITQFGCLLRMFLSGMSEISSHVISWLYQTCLNNLVTSQIMPSSLSQVDNLLQTCYNKLGISIANTTCWQFVNRLATTCFQTCNNFWVFTRRVPHSKKCHPQTYCTLPGVYRFDPSCLQIATYCCRWKSVINMEKTTGRHFDILSMAGLMHLVNRTAALL